ncbi:hypothetical protein TWF281_002920 [Arthrobotrys megalospora]
MKIQFPTMALAGLLAATAFAAPAADPIPAPVLAVLKESGLQSEVRSIQVDTAVFIRQKTIKEIYLPSSSLSDEVRNSPVTSQRYIADLRTAKIISLPNKKTETD